MCWAAVATLEVKRFQNAELKPQCGERKARRLSRLLLVLGGFELSSDGSAVPSMGLGRVMRQAFAACWGLAKPKQVQREPPRQCGPVIPVCIL